MKRLILSLAILSVAMLAYESSAGEAGKRPDRKQGAAQGQKKGRPGQPGGGAAQRDPQQLVARMIQEFDSDGDQKLDATELAAWMQSMRQRRADGMRPGGRQGGPGQGRPGAQGQRRRGGPGKGDANGGRRAERQDAAQPGGQRPKRPDAE